MMCVVLVDYITLVFVWFCFLCQRGEKQNRKGIVKCAELIQKSLTLGYVVC